MARVSDFQKSQLIDFIEENYEYLFGKHPSMMGAHSKQAKWAEITAIWGRQSVLPHSGKR